VVDFGEWAGRLAIPLTCAAAPSGMEGRLPCTNSHKGWTDERDPVMRSLAVVKPRCGHSRLRNQIRLCGIRGGVTNLVQQ
jgi:hypothetical protein